jgi:phage gp45-like
VAGLIRRMVVTLAQGGRWQLRGFRSLGEVVADVEVFAGLGLWARAPEGVEVEAVVVAVGDSKAPVVVALRDERTRSRVAAAIAADTTVLHNSACGVYLTPAGLVEIRSHAGAAGPLATLADAKALQAAIAAIPPPGDPSAAAAVAALQSAVASWSPVGTTKVRGE